MLPVRSMDQSTFDRGSATRSSAGSWGDFGQAVKHRDLTLTRRLVNGRWVMARPEERLFKE